MAETRAEVVLYTITLALIGAVILVVLVGFTIAAVTGPDVCADAVGGQCIP